ncbi:MAG: 5-dehydro-2-deoxygluconokinase [Candidatus Omnitrophica bacterium]|nr:5-dehydro-2-deoxygluconokinase [bacterium]MCL4733954.1 5-dehydro-2-deoxygluconokinase [Candidatus Omnitrophota bacterium]
MADKSFDLLSMGRSSIDLYSNDIGAPFTEITSFGAFVGGCPTNVSVGTRRLGLRSVLLSGLGDDLVGDFLFQFLEKEGVETRFMPRKKGFRTSAVLLGIEPPDRFPLVYYRQGCADIEITIDDVLAAPIRESRALFISGTGLSREPSRSATFFAAEQARASGGVVILDIDFRADQWHDARAFGVVTRSILHLVDYVIGTEEEVKAAALTDSGQISIAHSQVSDPNVQGDREAAIQAILVGGPQALIMKQGVQGATVFLPDGEWRHAAPYPVEVLNILGAGDAFASGFIYGLLKGWDLVKAARMGNAAGAIVVTRHGCANFMPYEQEALEFIESRGGF